MQIEVNFEDKRWDRHGLTELATRACGATLAHLGYSVDFEIGLLACDDDRIAALNADFRGKAQPTNVLSWPSEERSVTPGENPPAPTGSELGDIAIAFDTCLREAAEQGKDFATHVTHLLVHATLHLLGYDHIIEKDAALMEGVEVEILGNLGISNPYEE